tara:strand:- start:2336 stop:3505 length:1170 start_codon:yes stop_codon:yes gene_type:complete
MTQTSKPTTKPDCPHFSSGPCAKRPGWTTDALKDVLEGRSHRSKPGVAKLKAVIDQSAELLNLPEGYVLGIVPASDTGAVEMAMWNLLGPLGVDAAGWEVFGKIWIYDATKELGLSDVRTFEPETFGTLPDISDLDCDRDVVFTWNGTTAGVKMPHTDWIRDDRKGLMICDATSAIFAMEIPLEKLDVITWSWQKVLGSEAGFGMIALSPRAQARLESFTPDRPMPKIFRLTKGGKLISGIFEGKTINTPSMLAVEDCLDSLKWAQGIGGLDAMIKRGRENLDTVGKWVSDREWIDFMVEDENARASTSITLKVVDPWFTDQDEETQWKIVKDIVSLLENEDVGYDFANHRDAVPGFRIWGGSTVEKSDIEKLLPWLDWGYENVKAKAA